MRQQEQPADTHGLRQAARESPRAGAVAIVISGTFFLLCTTARLLQFQARNRGAS
jgi:hypothetical protein